MSGVAHQPHELAAGDECLAGDFFAPPPLDDDWRALHLAPPDPAGEPLEPPEPAPAIPGAPPDDPCALAPEPEAPTPPDEEISALEPEAADDPDDLGPPELGPPESAVLHRPRLPRASSEDWLAPPAVHIPEVLPPASAADELDPADPGAPDVLPDIAAREPLALPPPVAIAPSERPVPAAVARPRPRRRRLPAFACAVVAVVGAEIALGWWNAPPPEILVRDVAVARGIHPDDFVRIAEIESRLDPKAFNRRSKAAGLFQLLPSTAAQYAVTDSFDARANAEAAARLLKHNAGRLKKALGREPTAWELYLAHQQGATGAIKLLKNPEKKAVEVVGRLPVLWNRGTEDMTARQFASMWREAFNGRKKPAALN